MPFGVMSPIPPRPKPPTFVPNRGGNVNNSTTPYSTPSPKPLGPQQGGGSFGMDVMTPADWDFRNSIDAQSRQLSASWNLEDTQLSNMWKNNAAYADQSNALKNKALMLQGSGAGADNANERFRNEIAKMGNALDEQQIRKLWGINQDAFAANNTYYGDLLARTGEQHGFNQQTFDQGRSAIEQQFNTTTRAAKSDAAGRGAYGSQGFTDNLSDLVKQADTGYAQNKTSFDKAENSTNDQIALYNKRQQDLGFAHQTDQAQMEKALADNLLSRAQLDSLGKSIGIGSGQTAAAIQNAIEQNNLANANNLMNMQGQFGVTQAQNDAARAGMIGQLNAAGSAYGLPKISYKVPAPKTTSKPKLKRVI